MALPFKQQSTRPSSSGSSTSQREDRILIPALRGRVFPHWKGSSWVRLLPGVEGSNSDSYLVKVPILTRGNIQVVDPQFFNQRSLFREAHSLMKNSEEKDIVARRYNKDTNPNGVRCWPVDHYVAWILGIDPKASQFQVLVANANDGSIGGPMQLGHKILLQANRANDDPSLAEADRGKMLFEDVSSVVAGNHLNIQKLGEGGNTTYEASFSTNKSNIVATLEALPATELKDILRPLEQALHCPSIEEQIEILKALLGVQFFYKLFPEFVPAPGNADNHTESSPAVAATTAPVAEATPTPAATAAVAEAKPEPVATPVAAAVETPAPAAAAAGSTDGIQSLLENLTKFRDNNEDADAILKIQTVLKESPQFESFFTATLSPDEKTKLGFA